MILSGTFCMSACGSDSMFYNQRVRIAAKAKSLHLPTIFPVREHVEAGGLISYGVLPPNSARVESGRHAIEQPTKFDDINLTTAKTLDR
jgi:hypothetical protein